MRIGEGRREVTSRWWKKGDSGREWRALARYAWRTAAMAVLTGASGACIHDEDGLTRAPDPKLSLFATPSEQRVAQGGVTLFTLVVERTSFTGDVSLAVDPATVPSGVIVEFDPAVIPAGANQSVARVSVSATARVQYVEQPPLSEIRVLATGPSSLSADSKLPVRLVPSSLAGITMNVTPAEVTMLVGEVGEMLVTVARQGNYTGAVSLDITALNDVNGPGTAFGNLLAPTVTPVSGVPDTWRVRFFANNADKAVDLVRTAALVGGLLPFSIRATPQGLPPVSTTVRANLILPRFDPTDHSTRIAAGTQSEFPIRIGLNRSFRFTAPITMSIENAPPGITGTFSPNPAVDDATELTLRVAATVAPGNYEVRVLGVPSPASGASEKQSRIQVEVTPYIPYRISVPTTTLTAGAETTLPLTIARASGVTAPIRVQLAPSGGGPLPAGMTLSLAENPIAQSATTLRIGTTAATPAGQYFINVTGSAPGYDDVDTRFDVIVNAPPVSSNVARIELEPRNAEITAPATQQYRVLFFDGSGARISVESGGTLRFTSSVPTVASIDSTTGLATGVTAGTTTITARYLRNGVLVRQDASPLTVYAAGSAGHYGSAVISTNNNNQRTLRPGESLLFQLIVRDVAGTQITSGVTPAPTVASSSSSVAIVRCTSAELDLASPCYAVRNTPGYFYRMTAGSSATVGSSVKIRYDIVGAGGEITMVITP